MCGKCGIEIPLGRLKCVPNTKTCVKCSDVKYKAGITVTRGEGDHTYNETIIMEYDEFVQYEKMQEAKFGKRLDDFDNPDYFELDKKEKKSTDAE